MKWILLQIICMTIAGLLILLIRRMMGKKLYPWAITLLWGIFFVSALIPLTMVKDIRVCSQSEPERYVYGVHEGERYELAEADGIGDLVMQREYNVQILQLIQMAWVIGVIACLFYKTCAWLLLQRRLKALRVVYDTSGDEPSMLEEDYSGLLEVMQKYGISTRVIVTENFGPAVYGLTAKIFIPQMLCTNKTELQSILLHEYTHVKRKHAFTLMLSDIVSALYWFLPYVRKLFVPAMREDMEYRCDYEVIHKYGVKAKEYALHYVNTIETAHLTANELAFRREALKDRVDYMLKRKGHGKVSTVVSVVALILSLGGLAGVNAYYQLPNHNGHSRAEIEEAMEVILEYTAAYERGDVEAIQSLQVRELREDDVEYHNQYGEMRVYSLAYEEKANSYLKCSTRAQEYGSDYENYICIYGVATVRGKYQSYVEIPWGWDLIREDENSPWKIYSHGML